MKARCWLETGETGVSLADGSVLVGRNPDCDVVLTSDAVSRHHALFRVVEDGVEVIPLGRRGLTVNGVARHEGVALHDGDEVEVAGHRFVLRSEDLAEAEGDVHWFAEREPGVLLRLGREPVSVGGGVEDQLVIDGWDPGVVVLRPVGGRLVLEAMTPGISVGQPLDVGDLAPLRSGDRVEHHGRWFRVVALPADPSKPTGQPALDAPASGVALTLLPRGGRLTVTTGARVRSAYLAEKRCELAALLLRPPEPYVVGEMIPDAVLVDRLWPGTSSGRLEINTLVCRLRKDLERAGIDGVVLIERRGGAVCLNLSPDDRATVTNP